MMFQLHHYNGRRDTDEKLPWHPTKLPFISHQIINMDVLVGPRKTCRYSENIKPKFHCRWCHTPETGIFKNPLTLLALKSVM
jgi:hypothetical protein